MPAAPVSSAPSASASAIASASPSPVRVSPTPATSPSAAASPSPAASPAPAASPSAVPPPVGGTSNASIYLGDLFAGAVFIYSSNATGAVSPSAAIAGGMTGITDSNGASPIFGIAVDPSGTTYVLTQTFDSTNTVVAETIGVFPAGTYGNVAPARTIGLPVTIDGESLAYNGGNLYVADDAGAGSIDVVSASASGASTPTRTFTASGGFANPPNKISFDTSGNVYVATVDPTATAATEATQAVYRFPAGAGGAVAATQLTGAATGFANGVLEAAVVDGANRTDAVVQDAANDLYADIDEFAANATGNVAPVTSFQDTSSQGPVDAAVDAANAFYVSEIGATTQYAQVNVFANGAKTPTRTIQAYRSALALIAIGPYVAANASGTMATVRRGDARPAALRAIVARRNAHRASRGTAR